MRRPASPRQHLHHLGHREVAVVTLSLTRDRARGPLTPERVAAASSTTAMERLAGAHDVFPGAGGWVTRGSFVEEGRAAGRALLADARTRPTAIIAQSDLLAAGVIRAAEELGLEVPGDVSVVGFDGVRVDGLWPYDLTTLVQPAVDKGRAAGRAVVEMLAGGQPHPATFTSVFHQGNTTTAPKEALGPGRRLAAWISKRCTATCTPTPSSPSPSTAPPASSPTG
ncbi:substrate-binding domain-containing protein [Leifsonia sp. L25]|uniref:substrate-binding domain-containing protein n=1 Tax=Leifsonia sp. L25 TaxID=3423957 RepID=UPI003D69C10A